MLRFAVLNHDWPRPHRDLLLERGGVLKAWRLPAEFNLSDAIPAVESFDHRLHYLDYEGPVPGDRGTVGRWDGGALHWLIVREGRCVVRLDGAKLTGVFEMVRGEGGWRFSAVGQVHPADLDPPVGDGDGLQQGAGA